MSNSTLLFLALTAAFLLFRFMQSRADPALLAALQGALSRGAVVVDVRSPAEFSGGHVAGARNIPLHALQGRLGELGAKDREVVVYCRSGARSSQAASLLQRAGFTRVVNGKTRGNVESAAASAPASDAGDAPNRAERRRQQREARRGAAR